MRRTMRGGKLPKAARAERQTLDEIGLVVDRALNGGMTEREWHYALILMDGWGRTAHVTSLDPASYRNLLREQYDEGSTDALPREQPGQASRKHLGQRQEPAGETQKDRADHAGGKGGDDD